MQIWFIWKIIERRKTDEKMGIKGVESSEKKGWYIVVYDITNSNVKIYNTKGIKTNNNETKYCLDDIRNEE